MRTPLKSAFLLSFATVAFIACRWIWTGHHAYLFLIWNLFLAWAPWVISLGLNQDRPVSRLSAVFQTLGWLAFFPNAPYLFTDLIHLHSRPGAPLWMDLILLLLAAMAGWQIGLLSWMQVSAFWKPRLSRFSYRLGVFTLPFVSALGVYLGRFLRFNSWELVTSPGSMAVSFLDAVSQPRVALSMAAFTVAFGLLLHLLLLSQNQGLFFATEKTAE